MEYDNKSTIDTWKIWRLGALTLLHRWKLYITTISPPHRQISNRGVQDRFELRGSIELQSMEKNPCISRPEQFKSMFFNGQLCVIYLSYMSYTIFTKCPNMAYKSLPNLTPNDLSGLVSSSPCFCFTGPYISTSVLCECTYFRLEYPSLRVHLANNT